MPTYQHPGVYLEEISSGVRPIEGVATSIAAFVGEARRGDVGVPTLIHSLDEYLSLYATAGSAKEWMDLSVGAFYRNGGRDAYIVRVARKDGSTAAASLALKATSGTAEVDTILVQATSEGEWGDSLRVRVTRPSDDSSDPRFTLEIGRLETVGDRRSFVVDELYPGLSMNDRDLSYAIDTVNSASRSVRLDLATAAGSAAATKGTLAGRALSSTNKDYFSKAISDKSTLLVDLDGLGPRPVTLTSVKLEGNTREADGKAVAAAIKAAVASIAPDQEPFKSFDCTYDDNKGVFTLSSPASQHASVAVLADLGSANDAAQVLGLVGDGRTIAPGWSPLTPKALAKDPEDGGDGAHLRGGKAGRPQDTDFTSAFAALRKRREVTMVLLPGRVMPTDRPIIDIARAHCEELGNRVLLIDPPQGTPLTDATSINNLALPTSSYTVSYYPWVEIANPLFSPERSSTEPRTVKVAPSAFAAGVWSRIDGTRGVWKAPAGVEASLLGVARLEQDVGDSEQNVLNPEGINCLRVIPGFGPVVWGARTRSTRANPEWRYLPVRRTAILIEQSIYNGIQWAVFEPNDHRLWSSLRANIGAFMEGLFRAGAFQGERSSDAYFVRCGLGDTMTQGDIDRGQVIAIVGFAPLKPAEFVIVRIQQKVQQ